MFDIIQVKKCSFGLNLHGSYPHLCNSTMWSCIICSRGLVLHYCFPCDRISNGLGDIQDDTAPEVHWLFYCSHCYVPYDCHCSTVFGRLLSVVLYHALLKSEIKTILKKKNIFWVFIAIWGSLPVLGTMLIKQELRATLQHQQRQKFFCTSCLVKCCLKDRKSP